LRHKILWEAESLHLLWEISNKPSKLPGSGKTLTNIGRSISKLEPLGLKKITELLLNSANSLELACVNNIRKELALIYRVTSPSLIIR